MWVAHWPLRSPSSQGPVVFPWLVLARNRGVNLGCLRLQPPGPHLIHVRVSASAAPSIPALFSPTSCLSSTPLRARLRPLLCHRQG